MISLQFVPQFNFKFLTVRVYIYKFKLWGIKKYKFPNLAIKKHLNFIIYEDSYTSL